MAAETQVAEAAPPRVARRRLGIASLAVLLTAADTYVVVLALPAIMADVGIGLDELQRATPIVSVFLLGYVAVLPLIGRLSDVVGRTPVLLACLAAFTVGSAVTAAGDGLTAVVAGRFLQGLGGGGLVPVTLAVVADLWPPQRRGVPLGVVGAVQEAGSVLGPLYGAAVVALAGWREVFWLNAGLALVLAGLLRRSAPRTGRADVVGLLLLVAALGAGLVAIARPEALADSVAYGGALLPLVGDSVATTPLALTSIGLVAAWAVWTAATRADRWAAAARVARSVDLLGAALVAGLLGAVVLAFASADPEVSVLGPSGPALLALAAGLAAAFVWHSRRAADPLVPLAAFRDRAAWGSLAVSFAVGGALMAALVDVPFFARATRYPDSQLDAALVLVRLLAALPVGAVLGGLLAARYGDRLVAAAGTALASVSFVAMARWDADALGGPAATVALVTAGLGFGLAIAPVNAAALAAVRGPLAGLASSLVVVARMTGMLVGLSLLTAIGLRRFAAATADLPDPAVSCPTSPQDCPVYDEAVTAAVLDQLTTVFAGAAVFAALAAVLSLALLRPVRA